ncbi:MAG: hypothetical protein K0R65_509 [Crocinitomicaceae bacterium]|jgi:hypothetical protein|nr:hypothetical protein [Crocinitomicaceae bacterium]
MMRAAAGSFILLLLVHFSAQGQIDTNKVCFATRTEQAPKIDGVLEPETWGKAKPFSDFTMNRPIEGAAPTMKTEVAILYDDNAIYVSAMMYDPHPDSILHELGMRDDDLNADLFRFVIDPYNIRQDAFEFSVFASGVQQDFRFSDYTYNAVWESAVQINELGWAVEMRIPYSALRFPETAVQEWALQATRNIRRTREFDQWALTPSGVANGLFYWGTLKGIENIKTPLRLSFLPYVSAYSSRFPNPGDPGKTIGETSWKLGADVRYGINDYYTLDMTLLPDFGQVQSDNKVKNITFQEVMYDEYRQFFKEGTDLFSKNNLFYSRRIGKTPTLYYSVPYMVGEKETIISNPSSTRLINAAKLSGRNANGLGIGFFNAVTDEMHALVRDSIGNERKILTEPLTNYNILVLDKQLKNNSSLWFINTNTTRPRDWGNANVTGGGFNIALFKNTYAIDGSLNVSQYFEPKAGSNKALMNTPGYNYFVGFRKTTGKIQYGASRSVANDTYRQTDLGPFTIVNYENMRAYLVHQFFQPRKIFRSMYNEFSFNYSRHYESKMNTGVSVNASLNPVLMNFNAISLGAGGTPVAAYDFNEPRIMGRYNKTLRYWYAYVGFGSDSRKKLMANVNVTISNFIDRFVSEGYNSSWSLRYRFNDRFSVRYSGSYNFDPYNFGCADWYSQPDTIVFGLRKMHTFENSLFARFIFTNNMSLTLNGRHYWTNAAYSQYFNLEENGDITRTDTYSGNNDFSYNYFSVDLIYSWQFAPGSFLSLAYKNIIETQDQEIIYSFSKNFNQTIQSPQTNTVSLKLIYFFDYLYLKRWTKNR